MPRRKREELPRVLRFVHEYVWGKHSGNITKSALAAGYGNGKIPELHEESASNYGCQLLRRKSVADLVAKETSAKRELFKQKAIRVAEETYRQAVADIGDIFKEGRLLSTDEMPEDARRSIQSIEVEERTEGQGEDAETYYVHKVKLVDKKASQELFLKWAGDLKDKVELSGTVRLEDLVPKRKPAPAAAE